MGAEKGEESMLGYLLTRVCCIALGTVYPLYASYKIVKEERPYDELRAWLIYWIVLSCFGLTEFFSDILISWLPLYYETKLLLMLWMVHPKTRGAQKLYEQFIQPTLAHHEAQIDASLADAQVQAQVKGKELAQHGVSMLQRKGSVFLVQAYAAMQEQMGKAALAAVAAQAEQAAAAQQSQQCDGQPLNANAPLAQKDTKKDT